MATDAPKTLTPSQRGDLEDACAAWQGGRDSGSTPIRGAARRLTGTRHYFSAPFISAAENNADDLAFDRARVLLKALENADRRDASGWAASLGIPSQWVGRGIKSGPQDPQIVDSLRTGRLTMALWGMSFDRTVTSGYGDRFVFELVGDFPAVPAWKYSGVKEHEQELIVGGHYTIQDLIEEAPQTTVVRLRFDSTVPFLP
jgi:hypothetical protein